MNIFQQLESMTREEAIAIVNKIIDNYRKYLNFVLRDGCIVTHSEPYYRKLTNKGPVYSLAMLIYELSELNSVKKCGRVADWKTLYISELEDEINIKFFMEGVSK